MYFQELFTEANQGSFSPEGYPLNTVPSLVDGESNRKLITPVTAEEIRTALLGMNPDKAPGPDGFTTRFYLVCWDIVQKYLVRMVKKIPKLLQDRRRNKLLLPRPQP